MAEARKARAQAWISAPAYRTSDLHLTVPKFQELTNLLLERPNLNSSHLFRADILADSTGELQTIAEREQTRNHCQQSKAEQRASPATHDNADCSLHDIIPPQDNAFELRTGYTTPHDAGEFLLPGFQLVRTVVRRLIPRKPQIDRALEQTCFVYNLSCPESGEQSVFVAYVPRVASPDQIPWYHPKVKALAYRYDSVQDSATLSIHYQMFSGNNDELSSRLDRTFLSLLQTIVRLSKLESPRHGPNANDDLPVSAQAVNVAALRDTILQQHIVQDTYSRLKQTYAADLIARWVEKTEPSKHVFEDLSIAAFLIELWKSRYAEDKFPGFVDIACGNGVLVYILIKEGYQGQGFDARRRKTWGVLGINEHLEQKLCIPKPFWDVLDDDEIRSVLGDVSVHNGLFEQETFIISNHADELTPWTPILATMSCSEAPLPFFSIPCCSHALDGGKHRYTLREVDAGMQCTPATPELITTENEQPPTGDLKALRAQKAKAASHGDDSTYACLTKKTVALARELGFKTEMTLMRIPSTRNIGIVGRKPDLSTIIDGSTSERVAELLQRECGATGGIAASARAWIERARKHVEGEGRGKVNLRCDKAVVGHNQANGILGHEVNGVEQVDET